MTKRSDRTYHPDNPSAYPQRRVRADRVGNGRRIYEQELPEETIGTRPAGGGSSRRDRHSAIEDQLAELQSLATMANDWPETADRQPFRFGTRLAPLVFAVTAAAGLALFLVGMLPTSHEMPPANQNAEVRTFDAQGLGQTPPKIAERPTLPPAPQFIATQPTPRGTAEEISYGSPIRGTRQTTSIDAGQFPTASSAAPASQYDGEAITTLLNRGQQFLAVGDIATARVLLTRAAEARSARAAFALGSTYDPNVLERLGARGVTPDMTMARSWYQKAKDLGSVEASQRLDNLAGRLR